MFPIAVSLDCIYGPVDNKTALKFHGTSNKSANSIVKHGFNLGKKEHNMYGGGIYTADDPNKSAIYGTKLVISNVALGNSKKVIKGDKKINDDKLKAEGFDSVFSPGGNKHLGGVNLNEYVVYDKNKVSPAFVADFFRVPPKKRKPKILK